MTNPKNSPSSIIPGLRYRDAKTMIDWLCEVFGFEKQAVHPGPGDTVMHSQLTLGGGMVMVGSVSNDTASSKLLKQPDEVGGAETQSPYLMVPNIDAVYARAKRAGAKILMDMEEKDYGGKAFTCADSEGHIWHVGTFDPWESPQS
jgi:uncharacterized glyoxalase superfamily protein PhnB